VCPSWPFNVYACDAGVNTPAWGLAGTQRTGRRRPQAGSTPSDTQQPVRRELMRKVIALDPVVDEAIGESSTLRYHSPVLQRTVAVQLTRLPARLAREEADAVLRNIPQQLRSAASLGGPAPWMADPESMRGLCGAAARRLTAMPAGMPSLRLLADQTARVLTGLMHALDALALLTGKADPPDTGRRTASDASLRRILSEFP
jgi:hypothetical protein